jgi:hypothetical protein
MTTPEYDDAGRARIFHDELREQEYSEIIQLAEEYRAQTGPALDPQVHLVSLFDFTAGSSARPIPLADQADAIRNILAKTDTTDEEITRSRRHLAIFALREFATRLVIEGASDAYVRAVVDIIVANSLENIEEDPRY